MNYTELTYMPDGTALIYAIQNKATGKMYVGSTVEPHRRWVTHVRRLRAGEHTSFVLQKAWAKHGEPAFQYNPLLVCARTDRNMYEARMISALGEYNLMKDVGVPPAGAMRGRKHSAETIVAMKKSATARWASVGPRKSDLLCETAWGLVEEGTPRYIACKRAGVSHSTFWKWMKARDLMANLQPTCTKLCQEAWSLVLSGATKSNACIQVGVSHSTFWKWLAETKADIGGTS